MIFFNKTFFFIIGHKQKIRFRAIRYKTITSKFHYGSPVLSTNLTMLLFANV